MQERRPAKLDGHKRQAWHLSSAIRLRRTDHPKNGLRRIRPHDLGMIKYFLEVRQRGNRDDSPRPRYSHELVHVLPSFPGMEREHHLRGVHPVEATVLERQGQCISLDDVKSAGPTNRNVFLADVDAHCLGWVASDEGPDAASYIEDAFAGG